jgi:ketosteroid isomerase-like protein
VADSHYLVRLRDALESQDVDGLSALLAADVTWGAPGDPNPACRNRHQVVQWYQRGFDRGVRARVVEILSVGDSVLVGLIVTGNSVDHDVGQHVERWQVLAITDGLVSDIRGFEDRPSALAHASRASA